MNCNDLEPLIYLHAEGELSEQEQQQVRLHLETCEECRKLYASLRQMRGMTLQTERMPESLPSAEMVIRQINREVEYKQRRHILPLLRLAAASVLLFLASVFAWQEIHFNQSLTAMEQRLQRAKAFDAEATESYCLQRLKRKLHSPVFTSEYQAFNTLSDEQISSYLQQVCGTGDADAGALKEILQDAGVKQK